MNYIKIGSNTVLSRQSISGLYPGMTDAENALYIVYDSDQGENGSYSYTLTFKRQDGFTIGPVAIPVVSITNENDDNSFRAARYIFTAKDEVLSIPGSLQITIGIVSSTGRKVVVTSCNVGEGSSFTAEEKASIATLQAAVANLTQSEDAQAITREINGVYYSIIINSVGTPVLYEDHRNIPLGEEEYYNLLSEHDYAEESDILDIIGDDLPNIDDPGGVR